MKKLVFNLMKTLVFVLLAVVATIAIFEFIDCYSRWAMKQTNKRFLELKAKAETEMQKKHESEPK